MTDLSLVPIDTLLKELESRCIEFICAYKPIDFDKNVECKFYYGQADWFVACGLANILNNDVLNNWCGELRTLQKINEEVEE